MKTEEHTVALAKALLSSFVIRGAHLSITRRLASEHVVEIHKILISWVLKRIAAYDKNNNKAKRATALAFFRALIQLLATIQSRDALKM
jgi:cohesin complex subunit SA-1/2